MGIKYPLCDSDKAELLAWRRRFHQYPELSLEEAETSRRIAAYVQSLGLTPERVGEHGLTVTVYAPRHPDCKTAAIRAEMDAIPVEEQTDVPWKSKHPGIMHACGHDGILAVALVLVKLCVENREHLPVNVKFLFQPAEENGKGTKLMLDGGVMRNPDVDYFIMFHFVNDAPSGVEMQRGPSSAMIGTIDLTVHGRSSHWGNREMGIDSIEIAGKILGILDNLNRTYESAAPFVLGIGKIEGGTAKNVIAEQTHLLGTIRACDKADYETLQNRLSAQLDALQKEYGVAIEGQIGEDPTPPIVNDDEMVDVGMEAGERVWGRDCRLVQKQFLSGDSAAYYFEVAKGIFLVFTAEKAGEENYPLHNGKFDFDESVMEKATEFLFTYLTKL